MLVFFLSDLSLIGELLKIVCENVDVCLTHTHHMGRQRQPQTGIQTQQWFSVLWVSSLSLRAEGFYSLLLFWDIVVSVCAVAGGGGWLLLVRAYYVIALNLYRCCNEGNLIYTLLLSQRATRCFDWLGDFSSKFGFVPVFGVRNGSWGFLESKLKIQSIFKKEKNIWSS
mgnify:CR=1 FL=1